MTKKRAVAVPSAVEPLFHAMADEAPGTLSVLGVSPSGLVRMRHDASSPGRACTRRDFSIKWVRSLVLPSLLVQVRVAGCPPVVVSGIPSAVLAVALR